MKTYLKSLARRVTICVTAAAWLSIGCAAARADIYQWTYASNGYSKITSTTLCPDGAGVSAAPGADLSARDLTQAALWNANLTDADLSATVFTDAELRYATLTRANLAGADLTRATVWKAAMTDAILTDAIVAGADFNGVPLTESQFYSTASYKSGNLQGIKLYDVFMPGWNLAGKNLSYGQIGGGHSKLTGANLSGANLRYLRTIAPFAENVNLTGADLTGAMLSGTIFSGSTLTNAIFTDAEVGSYTEFAHTNLTPAQLYSTANYKKKDLNRISLQGNNLSNWDFADQNLMYADLSGTTTLTGTNLSRADLRGTAIAALDAAVTRNAIRVDGTIQNLSLAAGEKLSIRNCIVDSVYFPKPIPVHMTGTPSFDHDATLQIKFGQNMVFVPEWNSTISFDPNTNVKLDGILELTLDPGEWHPNLVGKSYKLFDWTGVNRTGAFSVVADNGTWDLSKLYTTGVVTLTAVPEPGALTLLLSAAGLALVGYRSLRSRRKDCR